MLVGSNAGALEHGDAFQAGAVVAGAAHVDSQPAQEATGTELHDANAAASAFAEENARRRTSVHEFAESKPLQKLCVMREVLTPL